MSEYYGFIKKIDGKEYKYRSLSRKKETAQEQAKSLRDKNYSVRIIPSKTGRGDKVFLIYKRWKGKGPRYKDLTRGERKIINLLERERSDLVVDISHKTGMYQDYIEKALKKLAKKGYVKKRLVQPYRSLREYKYWDIQD